MYDIMYISIYGMYVLWSSFNTPYGKFKTYQNYKQFYSNIKIKLMNQVTHHDFGSFETELLSVDFISFNSLLTSVKAAPPMIR